VILALLLACAARVVAPTPPSPVADSGSPAEARRLAMEAILLWEEGQPAAAEASLRQLQRFDPKAAWPVMMLAELAREREDFAAALPLYEEAVRRDPGLVRGWLRLAYERARVGEVLAADEALARAVEVDESGRAWLYRVAIAEDLARQDLGGEDLLRERVAAWRASGQATDAEQLRYRIEVSLRVGDRRGAWEDLDELLFLEPDDEASLERYLELSRELGRRELALRRIEALLRAYPSEAVLRRLALYLDEEREEGLHARVLLHMEEEGLLLPSSIR